jgi:hypothetical protein
MTIEGSKQPVHPVYKDDLSLVYEMESQQRFFRAKLSSKIDFVAGDADVIVAAPFGTDFIIDMEISGDMGLTWAQYYRCHFHKTDCTINYDDRKVTVQPDTLDQYNDILAGLDKEFNLIELAPAIQPIGLTKRPMFQIWVSGESIVSCLCGGNAFEQDMMETGENRVRECHFGSLDASWEFNFQDPPVSGFGSPFVGFFNGNGSEFWSNDTTYYLKYFEYSEPITDTGYIGWFNGIRIIETATGNVIWEFEQEKLSGYEDDYKDIPAELVFSGNPQLTAYKTSYGVYGRLVTDNSVNTNEIRQDDVVVNNRNYHYCMPYTDFQLTQSGRTSVEPTKWGRNDSGLYFLPPDDVRQWYPVGRSQWVNTSLWVQYTSSMVIMERTQRKGFTLRDAFPVWSVLQVLLGKVAPSVTHEGTTTYSDFLYGSAKGITDMTRLFLAPKSNVIVGEYQEPAMKAPVTLGEVLSMLRKVYGCYWFVDGQSRLRIEHVRWFKNGGAYSGDRVIGTDLTEALNVRNGKPWAFATSEVKYNKEDMPERYQYEWMDDSTEMFNGQPVNVLSAFVHEGKVEEVTVSGYTSDVDYMMLAPEMCSKDGFALLAAEAVEGGYSVPIVSTTFGQYALEVQNYYLCMRYLVPAFLTYDMPSWDIEVNGRQSRAAGIQRNRQQTVNIPVGGNDPDMLRLVRTYIGDGEWGRTEINLSSRMAKTQLNYDTYDEE